MIRVLEVLATLKRAGAETMAVSLAAGLDPARFEPAVVSLYDAFPDGLEAALEQHAIPLWHLGKRRGFDPRMYRRLGRVVHAFRPDIVHTHSYVMRYTIALPAPAMVHTVHNVAGREVDALGRLVHRVGFRRGVVAVAVAAEVAASFESVYGFAPVTIPNGIDVECFRRAAGERIHWRRAHGFADSDVLVVSVARLVPQKNPVLLADALAGVPGVHLLIAGDGPLAPVLAGRERVHLLGVRDDIPQLLAASDIFALASDWEGHPIAVMEALAAGLPVVATSAGGIPEIVRHGETGLLVAPGDRSALASALAQLAADADVRRTMSRAARERAAGFGVKTMVDRYSALFEQICESRC